MTLQEELKFARERVEETARELQSTWKKLKKFRTVRVHDCCRMADPERGFYISDGCPKCRFNHLCRELDVGGETVDKIAG